MATVPVQVPVTFNVRLAHARLDRARRDITDVRRSAVWRLSPSERKALLDAVDVPDRVKQAIGPRPVLYRTGGSSGAGDGR